MPHQSTEATKNVGESNRAPRTQPELLRVRDLSVSGAGGSFSIVDEVSFELLPGRQLALVGESGSGKTTVALALLGYARPGTMISGGTVHVQNLEMLSIGERERRSARGREIAYVPQDPSTALSPGMRIGQAVREMLQVHDPAATNVDSRVAAALREAQLPDDGHFQGRYPHQLSGGQQQRVAIALALVCRPRVLVLDEPTTGLDVTTQARLLDVVREIVTQTGVGLVYVTHDLGLVRNLVDDVAVMYGGRIVEKGPIGTVFARPMHPYTRGLLEAVPRVTPTAFPPREIPGTAVDPWEWPAGCPFAPRCSHRIEPCEVSMPPIEILPDGRVVRCIRHRHLPRSPVPHVVPLQQGTEESQPVDSAYLAVRGLKATYGRSSLAVSGVSFDVPRGMCTAVVGESGSGKTTTLRCIAGLHHPVAGSILVGGLDIAGKARERDRELRRKIQLVPQNPDSSLNPRRTTAEIIGRPLRQFFGMRANDQRRRTIELLGLVRLPSGLGYRYPHELSGGQRQRVAIARALAAEPELLLCDEIVAALDVAVQAGILRLLDEIRRDLDVTVVFVSHDLAVVRSISSQVVVMETGSVCEAGASERIFEDPQHPYTKALLGAVPDLQEGDYPGNVDVPAQRRL
jgi:peptide/nickel transport system ATP-binding protein